METDFFAYLDEAMELSVRLERASPHSSGFYEYMQEDRYSGQKSLRHTMDWIVDDFATESESGTIQLYCRWCAYIIHYIHFRMEFISLKPDLLSAILVVPQVSIETKRKLLAQGFGKREILDLLHHVRTRGEWILGDGGYDAVTQTIANMCSQVTENSKGG
ncbi:MAG: hypothetical protein LUC93_10350 [Planctomycetaceae bacterium]|nr:hypothetical protein [Planctomycetaceae bacterium]